jgi:hypothetical protein
MSGFELALLAIRSGGRAQSPSSKQWVFMEDGMLCVHTETFGSLHWIDTRRDLVSNDWVVEWPHEKGQPNTDEE